MGDVSAALPANGDPLLSLETARLPPPAISLLDLPTSVLDDIIRRALQHGAGEALSLSCRALSQTRLLHAPSFRVKLVRQHCEQLFTTRVVVALRARTDKLALALEQDQEANSRPKEEHIDLLDHVFAKLGSCAAVEACRLSSTYSYNYTTLPLGCTPCLAQHLHTSFPSLTALSLHGYSVTCSGLASLLAHPHLCLQLQQLDLTRTTITQQPDQPGAATLYNLFHGARLQQLSLVVNEGTPLPNLAPLAQHLTQLHLMMGDMYNFEYLGALMASLRALVRLQVLVSGQGSLMELPELLLALPQLHTLQLPNAMDAQDQHLDLLLAATHLTSLQLGALCELTTSRAHMPCSWQRLVLAGVPHTTLAYLPLHSLTQPLELDWLQTRVNEMPPTEVAAALHGLRRYCKVPVRVNTLNVDWRSSLSTCVRSRQWKDNLAQLLALLQPLRLDSLAAVSISHLHGLCAADVASLAPLCRGCFHLEFICGSVSPSLHLWRQLVQRIPTVTHVSFHYCNGTATAAMHKSLLLMAQQPWARWLDITFHQQYRSKVLPCWQTDCLSGIVKLRVNITC